MREAHPPSFVVSRSLYWLLVGDPDKDAQLGESGWMLP